ncbi:hypothetical protein TNCV_435041 [Trichonephila clavipes]|nr:hypothetical protein TNCV_435041 [Trichonephila clavipes]
MLQPLQAPLKLLISYYHGTANREVTHPVPPTNHSAYFPHPVHSNKSRLPHQTLTSTPLLRPTTTSSTTSLQPTNQVAACFPSRFIPLPQATFTFRSGTEERFAFHVPVNLTQSYSQPISLGFFYSHGVIFSMNWILTRTIEVDWSPLLTVARKRSPSIT